MRISAENTPVWNYPQPDVKNRYLDPAKYDKSDSLPLSTLKPPEIHSQRAPRRLALSIGRTTTTLDDIEKQLERLLGKGDHVSLAVGAVARVGDLSGLCFWR